MVSAVTGRRGGSTLHRRIPQRVGILVTAVLLFVTSCRTPAPLPTNRAELDTQILQAGDVVKIAFPGAPNLDTSQQIRRDGRINLAIVGEIVAADRTPAALEQELARLYGPQLVSKEVKVTVVSSSYSVYVSGAVMKPGKVTAERALTALEAIMEAGGFDSEKAKAKAVVVIRNENGESKNYRVDLQAVLDGKSKETFYLKSRDIVHVPEKFVWF